MSLGDQIAAEIAEGIREAARDTGSGELSVTIIRQGARTGPEYAPTIGAPTEYTASALRSQFTLKERESALVQQGMIKVLVAATLAISPTTQDTARIDGIEYQIKEVMPLQPSDTVLIWTLWLLR